MYLLVFYDDELNTTGLVNANTAIDSKFDVYTSSKERFLR